MKKLIFTLAAIVVCSGAFAQQTPTMVQLQAQENDYVEVNARAWREVTPDEIFLGITLDQNDTKGKYTIDQLESQLYQALKKAGVDAEKDLRVSDMTLDYKTFLLKKNEGRTTKEYVLKVDNEHLMPVFRELSNVGISNVNIQSVRYSKTREVYNELIGEAVATAKQRAEIMAQGAGQSIKQMIFAQTYDNTAAYDAGMASNAVFYAAKARAAGPEAAPTFEFNKIRIEVNVSARFRLWYK